MVCGNESIGLKPQSLHYCQGYIFCGTGERNQGYVLMMKCNKPELTVQAPTFFFSFCNIVELVHVSKLIGYCLTVFHVYTIGAMFTI